MRWECDLLVFRVLEKCGLWRTLPFCQYVDGSYLVPSSLCNHGYLCEYFTLTASALQTRVLVSDWIVGVMSSHSVSAFR